MAGENWNEPPSPELAFTAVGSSWLSHHSIESKIGGKTGLATTGAGAADSVAVAMLADPTAVTDVVVVVVVEVTGEVRKSSDTMLELSAGLAACAFSGTATSREPRALGGGIPVALNGRGKACVVG